MFKASVAVAVTTALMLAATAAAASWHVIGKASSRGDSAATAASGQAKHPHQLAVRLTGNGVSGFGAVACSKGFKISSKSTTYKGAGVHLLKLPMTNADSCRVTASVAGSGKITLQILAR